MKLVILMGLAFVGLANTFKFLNTFDNESAKSLIVETISKAFIRRLAQEGRSKDSPNNKNVLLPVLPGLLPILPGTYPVNITMGVVGNDVNFVGDINIKSIGAIVGLDHLQDDFRLQIPLSMTYSVKLPSVYASAKYDMKMNATLGRSHDMVGEGLMSFSVTDVFFIIRAGFSETVELGIKDLTVDFGFKNLSLNFQNTFLDTTPIEWDRQSSNLQTYFDTLWGTNDEVKGIITESVQCATTSMIQGCTLVDLSVGKLDDCLAFEDLQSACRVEEATTADSKGFLISVSNTIVILACAVSWSFYLSHDMKIFNSFVEI